MTKIRTRSITPAVPGRLMLITHPPPAWVCIPAATLVARRLADAPEMTRFPAPAHHVARRMAGRWRGTVEMLSGRDRGSGDTLGIVMGLAPERTSVRDTRQYRVVLASGRMTDAAAAVWLGFISRPVAARPVVFTWEGEG